MQPFFAIMVYNSLITIIMFLFYLKVFVLALFSCFLLTWLVRKFVIKSKLFDNPSTDPDRKIQKKPIPTSGGLAVFITFSLLIILFALFSDRLIGLNIHVKYVWGLVLAGIVLMVGGFLDDKYRLSPKKSIIAPVIATLIVIFCGVGVKVVTNPFGGVFHLDAVEWEILKIKGMPYHLTLWSDLFTFIWLLGMMYTTKLLDGLDGLVSGVSGIGAIIIFFLVTTTVFFQPDTALLSIIFAGACLGFLILNFHPAKIFLGEGGSLYCGFILGVLAIISGGKIATALLVMGIPILDVIWVIFRRAIKEKRSPFKFGDSKHLHFRLLAAGFSHRGAVIFYYLVAIVFGVLTLFLQSKEKMIALGVLVLLMLAVGIFVVYKKRKVRSL